MILRGMVKKGKIHLDGAAELPEGAEVEVRFIRPKASVGPRKRKPASVADRLSKVIGKATGLPPDASVNHDHYLYGMPKRS
jgi:hypothetical protein